jgi:quercetin dioxygenase-like cupin family protein
MQLHSESRALRFDLTQELDQLRQGETWQQHDRTAKTLAKEPHLRVTLVALKSGARLDEHEAEGAITIHTLSGRLRVSVPGESMDCASGALLVLERGVPHAVEALEESAFLLTVGWPR